jgi:SAM-dependent methyltransferase
MSELVESKEALTREMTRGDREKLAYEEGVWEVSDEWHRRFLHVFKCPNSEKHELQIQKWITDAAQGRRALDIGCGRGEISRKVLDAGAGYVLGIDISDHEVEFARRGEVRDRLEFIVGSAEDPIEGCFDVIYGFSILHHLDYRAMLTRMYAENLSAGGIITFQEPLGESFLTRAYKWKVRNAHTPDERSFLKQDLDWFRQNFPETRIEAFGYASYLFGIVSSRLFRNPNNFLMQCCDVLDTKLGGFTFLKHRFRRCNILIQKPS